MILHLYLQKIKSQSCGLRSVCDSSYMLMPILISPRRYRVLMDILYIMTEKDRGNSNILGPRKLYIILKRIMPIRHG